MSARRLKLQRWMDLIAALLRHRYGVTLEELIRQVPAYAAAPSDGAMTRMFERDKEELRGLGLVFETLLEDNGESASYLLRRRDFYLPFIEPATRIGSAARREGYRDLPRVALEDDEIATLDDAAVRVTRLGDPMLAADALAAVRKLAFDLPRGTFTSLAAVAALPLESTASVRTFELLDLAIRRRKRLFFAYCAAGHEDIEPREAEPYGLLCLEGQWLLVARDRVRGQLCRFRVDRMQSLALNERLAKSPDYEVPAGFDLSELAWWPLSWDERDDGTLETVRAHVRETLAMYRTPGCQGPSV